jgi:two-component system sensor histidine kinase HydH
MVQGAQNQKVTFNVNFPAEDYEIFADVKQMELVLLNLYHNSIQSIDAKRKNNRSFAGGRIEVTTEVVEQYLHVLWSDDGAGIAAEDLPHIFEPLFTKNKPLGSGLGLYLSTNVVKGHDGTLTATSEPGSGACFTIALPIVETGLNSKENLPKWSIDWRTH